MYNVHTLFVALCKFYHVIIRRLKLKKDNTERKKIFLPLFYLNVISINFQCRKMFNKKNNP